MLKAEFTSISFKLKQLLCHEKHLGVEENVAKDAKASSVSNTRRPESLL